MCSTGMGASSRRGRRAPVGGPAFILVRGATSCAWAIHARCRSRRLRARSRAWRVRNRPSRTSGLPQSTPSGMCRWSAASSARGQPSPSQRQFPSLGARRTSTTCGSSKPTSPAGPTDEIPDASPIVAVLENGHAVTVCFCARRASFAAEAGLETAPPFRGRGFGPRVAAAWALAMRASGRTPLYSTSWSNDASLAVASKLGLIPYAATWNLSGQSRPEAYP